MEFGHIFVESVACCAQRTILY